MGVDKRNYLQGTLEFYELNGSRTLADTVAHGYSLTAHAYQLDLSGVEPVATLPRTAKP